MADEVCARLGFHDLVGKPQRSGCLKALRKLEREGCFVLPAATGKVGLPKSPRRLSEPLAPVEGLPDQVHDVTGMSRLLIRRDVRCANLASRVLALAMRAMPTDFNLRYGYEPYLVESFVDTESFSGAVYRAANWIKVGRTQGRGRQDRERKAAVSVKDIYVYPLVNDFRKRLGLPDQAGLGELSPSEGLDREDWAGKEFGNAPLGDARLCDRLVEIATMKGKHPSKSFCAVARGDRMEAKNYYRFIDKPDASAVNMENILAPHRKRTIRRMKAQETVLCVQDGSELNYNNLDRCEGLGYIGSNQTGAQSRGLHLHSTLAVSTTGLVLGILKAKCEARQPGENNETTGAIPIEQKNTFCWIEGLRDTVEAAAEMPGTRLVNVLDRDADFFELFDDMPVRLPPPSHHPDKTPLDLWLVHALEECPPDGEEPVEWFLLTSIEIDSPETAVECVRWYCLRWRIEDWHRVLKSGCRVEDLANESADRLRRAIAINLVIAWRIMLMTLLGREAPNLPAEVVFSDIELKVLEAYAKKKTGIPRHHWVKPF